MNKKYLSFSKTILLMAIVLCLPFTILSVKATDNSKVKATFHFEYGNKSDVVLDLDSGSTLNDQYPKQDNFNQRFEANDRGNGNTSLNLELAGFVKDGVLIKLEDMANEVVKEDVTYNAFYNIVADYTLVLFDGRTDYDHLNDQQIQEKLNSEFGAKSTSDDKVYAVKWQQVSQEKVTTQMGKVPNITRYEYKATNKMPLKDLAGNHIYYKWNNSNEIIAEPFYIASTAGNAENGATLVYATNFYQWFFVYVSDGSASNPVDVKVNTKLVYPSAYGPKLHESSKTYDIKANGEYQYFDLAANGSSENANVTTTGSTTLWETNLRNYTATWSNGYKGFGGVTLKVEPQPLAGYTLVKRGNGVFNNDGKHQAYTFAYFKNITLKFNAAAGNTKIAGNDKDVEEIVALQTQKLDVNKVPSVKPINSYTFVGWADKDDSSKKVVNFNDYVVTKDTEFVPVFAVNNTPNPNNGDTSVVIPNPVMPAVVEDNSNLNQTLPKTGVK